MLARADAPKRVFPRRLHAAQHLGHGLDARIVRDVGDVRRGVLRSPDPLQHAHHFDSLFRRQLVHAAADRAHAQKRNPHTNLRNSNLICP